MYKFIKLRHGILIECQGNYIEMIKFNYMLEIDILRNSSPKKVGVLTGAFEGFGCPKRHPDALLAKTMQKLGCSLVQVCLVIQLYLYGDILRKLTMNSF